MKKSIFISLSVVLVMLALTVGIVIRAKVATQNKEAEREQEEVSEVYVSFHPDSLNEEKLEEYLDWKRKLAAKGNDFSQFEIQEEYNSRKSVSEDGIYSYAEDQINGSWHKKSFMGGIGFRVDGSAYDPGNDDFYAVSYAGRLYKLDKDAENKWSIRNNKKHFLNNGLNGINVADGSFRLIQMQNDGGMEYSDDEGRTWTTAKGALFENNWNHSTHITNGPSGKRIIVHGGNYHGGSGYHHIYVSDDYGLNYRDLSKHWARSGYSVMVQKAFNSDNVYAFVLNSSSGKIDIYRMTAEETEFSKISTTSTSFSKLSRLYATYVNGQFHFYVNEGTIVYYSSDEGASWTMIKEGNDKAISAIHPTKPNVVFKGFVQLVMSTDFGANWSANGHKLNTYYTWDLQHIKVYEKSDGSHVTFAGLDFGCYYSEDPSDWSSWQTLNPGSPIMMCYDAASSDKFNVGYVALQDRGVRGYKNAGGENDQYWDSELGSTDVLRVTVSNDESSVWYWYYYGKIARSDVRADAKKANVAEKYFYGKWWSANMIASPDKYEDAVYVCTGTKLQKLSYFGGSISRTYHPYEFSSSVNSFGYSSVDTDRWYVGLKSGSFYYSADGGDTFTRSSYSGGWPGQVDSYKRTRQVIKACPQDPNTVYYAGKGNIFLVSKDGGKTFTNHNRGLNTWRFRDFDISADGRFVFGACATAGAWVFSVETDTWYKMDGDDVDYVDYTTTKYLNSNNTVRFTSYGGGVVDFKLNESLQGEPAFTNVALKKPVTTSSQASDNYGGANIVDGSVASNASPFWLSKYNADLPQWVEIDLEGHYMLTAFNMWKGYSGFAGPMIDFEFQLWEDDDWSTVFSVDDFDELFYREKLDSLVTSRVRVFITEASSPQLQLFEIQLTGKFLRGLGVNEKSRLVHELKLYPNPASEYVIISDSEDVQEYQLFTIEGKLVRNGIGNRIELGDLSDGMYIVKTSQGSGQLVVKK